MAGVRMTGLVSGLDTEALVGQLSKAYQTKVDNVKKEQTKLEWKKEAWTALNTKLMDFYKGALSTFSSVSTYRTKAATGNLTGVKITAGSKAVNGSHRVKVISTATAQMWTGKKFKVSANGADYNVKVNVGDDATIQDVLDNINGQLNGSGIKVDFAAGNFRMSNESAVSSEIQNDTGETVTVFNGGYDAKIIAADEATAAIFGVTTEGEGTLLEPRSSDPDKDPVTTIGGATRFYEEVQTADTKVTASSKLVDLGIAEGTEIKINGNAITVDRTTTLNSLATQMAKLGIEANYDAGQGRFYLNSKATGKDNSFTLEAVNADGTTSDALSKLGLDLQAGDEGRIDAENAVIEYNGVRYEQASSTFDINGLTIEATEKGETQTFNVGTDTQAIYDEEKAAMNEKDIEKWEGVIKASLLRRDDTISSLLSSMRSTLNKQVSVTGSDGTTKNYSLSSFGINTSVYTERGKLHIYGDKDDGDFADFEDSLMKAINENPEAVEKTLSTLGSEIYKNLQKAMSGDRELSSALTFYNDKQLDKEIKEYKDRVSTLQDKMLAEQDKYYKQFSAMESALAKLQSQQTYIAQLFGG